MTHEIWDTVKWLRSHCSININPEEDIFIICCICKEIMIDACQFLCGCRFCRECIECYLRKDGKHCPANITDECRSVKAKETKSFHTEVQSNKIILSLLAQCPIVGCNIKGQLREIIEHVDLCRIENEDDVENDNSETTITLRNRVDLLENNLGNKTSDIEKMIELFNAQMLSLEETANKVIKRIDSLEINIGTLEIKISEARNIDFLWKIDNYSTKKRLNSHIYSEYFYTKLNGYKLRMLFYPNGDTFKGTHMSLYFQIANGDYDDVLPWPFKYNVTMSVLDQEGLARNHSVTIPYQSSAIYEAIYQKPESIENRSHGKSQFFELSNLTSLTYLKMNDTIYLRTSLSKS